MVTLKLPKHYIGNGTTEARKELLPKLKIEKCQDWKCGRNWHAVYEDGYSLNLHYAVGKNGYRKSDIKLVT